MGIFDKMPDNSFPKQSLAVGVLTVLLRGLVLYAVTAAAAAEHFLL